MKRRGGLCQPDRTEQHARGRAQLDCNVPQRQRRPCAGLSVIGRPLQYRQKPGAQSVCKQQREGQQPDLADQQPPIARAQQITFVLDVKISQPDPGHDDDGHQRHRQLREALQGGGKGRRRQGRRLVAGIRSDRQQPRRQGAEPYCDGKHVGDVGRQNLPRCFRTGAVTAPGCKSKVEGRRDRAGPACALNRPNHCHQHTHKQQRGRPGSNQPNLTEVRAHHQVAPVGCCPPERDESEHLCPHQTSMTHRKHRDGDQQRSGPRHRRLEELARHAPSVEEGRTDDPGRTRESRQSGCRSQNFDHPDLRVLSI